MDVNYKKKIELEKIIPIIRSEITFNSTPSAIFILDKDRKILEWNKKAEELTGFSRNEIIGKKCTHFAELPCKKNCALYDLSISKPLYNQECTIRCKDDTNLFIKKNVDVLWDNDRNIIGGIESFFDITENKKHQDELQEINNKFKHILNIAADGIRFVSDEFKVQSMNDTMSNLMGLSEEDGKGMMCHEMFESEWCGTSECSLIKILRDGKGFERKEKRKNTEGKIIDCLCSVKPYRDKYGKIIGIVEDFRDITELKSIEEKLQIKNNELNMLNKELFIAREQLIDLNGNLELLVDERTKQVHKLIQQKDEFINQLGHDLKNPLGPILNLLPILLEKEKDEHKKEMIHVMLRNAEYIKSLVVKTIDLAKLNSSDVALHLEKVDLFDLVENTIKLNQSFFSQKQIDIMNDIPYDITISVDQIRIQELINNLLSNAVKYSNEYGKICINATIKMNNVIVTIKDNGIGMTKHQIENIFTEFYKADSARHDFNSSGLGLSICKKIIHKHNGKLWAESEGIGQGSTFFFSLPLC